MRITLEIITFMSFMVLAFGQILAIDFGTQFIKAAVVNKGSGKAFSIVENPKSERKFINSIGFYSEERFYEAESIPKRTRYPKNCFIFNKLLVDSLDNPSLTTTIKDDLLMEYIHSGITDPLQAEFTLEGFPAGSSKVTLIEVMAMIIKYARANAEKQIKDQIKDVVITIPSHWSIKMRAFVIQAAQIADLHVLSLISENSGAAINYALNQRTKNTTQTILFYNLGSNYLQMSLVQFKGVPAEKSAKPVESIFVLAERAKTYVGGLRFDVALFKFFKQRFEKKYNKKLNMRGSIKLWGEIAEVKEVLSANKEAPVYVEGIMDGIDYNDKITRAEFETLIDPVLKEITSPIKRFLFDNNMRPEDIDNIELIGGSMRIPKLQSLIGEIVGNQSKIGTHINADEAMVLGAAFYGANSSKKFKVKGVNLYDGFNFEVRAVLKNLEDGIDESDSRYFFKNVTVFQKKSRFGLTKELSFKCHENIILELFKEDDNGIELLRSVKLDNIKDVNETDFKVSIILSLDPIEIVEVKKAEIKYKKDELTTYMEKVKKEKPSTKKADEAETKKDPNEDALVEKVEEEKQEAEEKETEEKEIEKQEVEEAKESQKEEEATESSDKQEKEEKEEKEEEENKEEEEKKEEKKDKKGEKKDKKKKQKKVEQEYETVERTKTVTKKYQKDLRVQEIFSREKADHDSQEKSRKMLKQYERTEDERKKLAESKNKLEALIYEIKEKLDNSDFMEYVQKSEKTKLEELVAEKSEWYDDTTSNNKHDYDEQSRALSKPLDKIKRRIHEYQSREAHYKKVQHSIKEYQDLSVNITKKKEWITEDEVNTLLKKIETMKQEVEDMYEKMEDTPQNESCIFQIKDLEKQAEKVKDEYFKVMAIPKPKKEKKEQKKSEKQEKSADESEQL